MHRSASWNRVADDFYKHRMADEYYTHHSSSKEMTQALRIPSSMEMSNELPAYDPILELAMKEKSRMKFAENAVHIIPLVLLFCGLILWFFSNPDVDVGVKVNSIASKIEGLTIEGDIDTDSDGTQTGFLPIEQGDLGMAKRTKDQRSFRKLFKKFE